MNEEQQLKLQAYLDGELAGGEREDAAALLARDAGARALLEELRWTSALLRENEAGRTLDCTREFYWNGIQRGIETSSGERATAPAGGPAVWLRRYFAPIAGAAAVIALLLVSALDFNPSPNPTAARAESEWEVVHPDTGMVNYRDYQNGITVVMLYDRTTPGFTSGD